MKKSFLFFTTILLVSTVSCKEQEAQGLQQSSLSEIGAAIQKMKQNSMFPEKTIANLLNKFKDVRFKAVSKACHARVTELLVKKDYQVLVGYADAVGKPASGLFLGNYFWPGSFSECHKITRSQYCIIGMNAHYYLGNVSIVNGNGVIGACTPKECSEKDIEQLLPILYRYFPSIRKYISFPKKTTLSRYGSNVLCEQNVKEFNTGSIITLTLCGVFVFLCVMGTFCEMMQSVLTRPSGNNLKLYAGQDPGDEEENNYIDNDKIPIFDTNHHESSTYSLPMPSIGTSIMDWLICFSLVKNTNMVLSTEAPKGAILSINGIRTLSMLWVILGHVFALGMTAGEANNVFDFYITLLNRFTFLPIANGFFSVDSFFLLSGLLMSYLSMRRFDKTGKMPVFMAYLHRFLRLTPAYMFVILFYVNLYPMIGDGPYWNCIMPKLFKKPCYDYWWTNLLYINNFYPKSLADECLGWSWYLANDMQFFLISPLILFFMHRFKLIGTFVINGVLIALSIGVTAVLIAVYNLDTLQSSAIQKPTPKYSYSDLIYIKPYCRVVPYLVGIVLGYILHRRMKMIGPFKWIWVMFGWIFAIACGMAVTYGTYNSVKGKDKGGHVFSKTESIIYGSLSRLSWSLGLAWVIYACQNNLASLVGSVLSWRGFIPLSRLTYGAYLIHPMTIFLYYSTLHSTFTYTDFIGAFQFVSIAFMSYAAAFILAIFVEYPLLNLEKKLFKNAS